MKKKVYSCGIDEVGRGALAGPLVVACVSFDDYCDIPIGIRDSKAISLKLRNNLYMEIIKRAEFSTSIISSKIIDKIGIQKSTEKAALQSFNKIKRSSTHIYLDSNINMNANVKYHSFKKGDCNFVSIAAASIIAKCTRDKIMLKLSKKFSQYGWQTNVGYGTKEHLLAIAKYGITKYHRISYQPIKSMYK